MWDEMNLDDATWIVPAERMKALREHKVPLSSRAVEILKEVGEFTGWFGFGVSFVEGEINFPIRR